MSKSKSKPVSPASAPATAPASATVTFIGRPGLSSMASIGAAQYEHVLEGGDLARAAEKFLGADYDLNKWAEAHWEEFKKGVFSRITAIQQAASEESGKRCPVYKTDSGKIIELSVAYVFATNPKTVAATDKALATAIRIKRTDYNSAASGAARNLDAAYKRLPEVKARRGAVESEPKTVDETVKEFFTKKIRSFAAKNAGITEAVMQAACSAALAVIHRAMKSN